MLDTVLYSILLVRPDTGSCLGLTWENQIKTDNYSIVEEQMWIDDKMRDYPSWIIGSMSIHVIPA